MFGVERTHRNIVDQKVVGRFQDIDQHLCHLIRLHHIVVRFRIISFTEKISSYRAGAKTGYFNAIVSQLLKKGFAEAAQTKFRSIIAAELRARSEEHTSELQSRFDLVCRLLLEKKKQQS